MNPDDIIHAAPAIAQGAGALAAAVPFTAVVKRMLGPAADEVAEMLRDQVRVYRYGRQLKLLEKAEKMAEDAGFTPQAVPPKVLFPLLEGASFEDDENLHDMWAALLANAASLEHATKVRPGFVAILRQMAPDEAGLLKWICVHDSIDPHSPADLFDIAKGFQSVVDDQIDADSPRLLVCLHLLIANGLITPLGPIHYATPLAFNFIEACCPPKPKT